MPGLRLNNPNRARTAAPPNPYAVHRAGTVVHLKRRAGIGAVSTQAEVQAGSAVVGAASGAAIGAAVGSVIPGLGTAIGFVVGAIADSLIHPGQGAQREAQAVAITNALNNLQTGNNVGATIPWIGTAQNPGLQQFLQALMTAGVWMNWDPSLQSPGVNGNWANTFIAAVKQVTQAVVANAPGAPISLNISNRPGGNDIVAGTFNFTNPGLSVGPDVISQKVIMGNGGLMYWMIIRTGETTAHASANANNASAQKVFALMVDHAASDYSAQAYKAPAAPVAAAPAATATTQPIAAPTVTGTTAAGTPVVAPGDESALIQQLIAQGASQTAAIQAAMASMEANGQNSQTPQAQQVLQTAAATAPTPAGLFGLSNTTWLIIAALAVGGYFLLKE
jgi:hypothetical protein